MLRKMGETPGAIKVAPIHDTALNTARKARLVALLHEHGQDAAAAAVVIGSSTAEGLRSDEIEIMGGRILMGDGCCRPCWGSCGGCGCGHP